MTLPRGCSICQKDKGLCRIENTALQQLEKLKTSKPSLLDGQTQQPSEPKRPAARHHRTHPEVPCALISQSKFGSMRGPT